MNALNKIKWLLDPYFSNFLSLIDLFESQVDNPTSIMENESPLAKTSTVVSPFTPSTPPELCLLDAPTESPDVQKCQEFVEKTFGCHLANGSPCSSLFPLEHCIQLRAQSSFLTRDELDLTLIGAIMSTVIQDDYVRDGHHKNLKNKNIMHASQEWDMQKTFTFLYNIG